MVRRRTVAAIGQPSVDPPQKLYPHGGGGVRGVKSKKIHSGIILSPKVMSLQGVEREMA